MTNIVLNKDEKIRGLAEFILNRDVKEFRIKIDARQHIIFKIKLTNNVDQVFCCYHYCTNNDQIEKYDKFESAGYISNGILYGGYSLSLILNPLGVSEWNHCFSELMLENKIEKYIKDYIVKHWDYLKKQQSSNSEYHRTISAEQDVEDWIIKQNLEEAPNYEYNPSFDFNIEEYILYLNEGEKFIYTKGNELIEQFKYSIHNTIVRWESAVKMFNEKKNNPDLIHIRDMRQAIKESKAKTVKVRIVKDNQKPIQITISTTSIMNCSPKTFIHLWDCPKYDRDLFESIYGRSANLYPEDIDEIFYRNKTIYKRGE